MTEPNPISWQTLTTDVLIVGGGTAGCFAAATLGANPDVSVLIAEKANITRSGCLAAGVNALNAYITEGHDPEFYVDYCLRDADGIARRDLLTTMAERLNAVTADLEDAGLVILRDADGKIVNRGPRNIKINGENIKPLLAAQAEAQPNVTVLNHVNITDLMIHDGRVVGAYGFSVGAPVAYAICARAVFVATGGAAGLYRPNNPGFSRHKMWYPPFNTGAGYAMGIRAGAEMTTFEMRFIALRCKDTIAPTGTIAQGVGAPQHNARGEAYEAKYGHTTSERLYGTVSENRAGRGPCVLATRGIGAAAEQDLYKAYLNMAPSQTLRWLENGQGPDAEDVEIEGTEPYLVGGHTASGYWIDAGRRTTLPGLYAGGDVAGGAPQKYVTGALAEGQIAAESILKDLDHLDFADEDESARPDYGAYFARGPEHVDTEQLEEAMQKVMDEYAGGISQGYQYNEARLETAKRRIAELTDLSATLSAESMDDLLRIYELTDRLTVCPVLIAHLEARKETRWHSFAENADYPDKDDAYACYINSITRDGKTQIIKRKLR
ncbi:adenylyl-sulfate reductase subunit alpha [uncultured Pseudoramibacter sp.]|uniref:adenylyl-sulfate reductase subunit alpha n=1 Tax=uncultured Pseudoramibacter sp. TaxID=1623493 RepID=UPI0025F96DCE|nr:adenylyl-sulfate reductase subunit alpha [uncultured Pseudoramibacter sp.]